MLPKRTRRRFLGDLAGLGAVVWGAPLPAATAVMPVPVSARPVASAFVGRGRYSVTSDPMDFRGALVDEILPFWERSVDREHGGFITDLDVDGYRQDGDEKQLFIQARMIYSFSMGHRLTGKPEYLAHAGQGVEFLKRHFWDEQHGGWFRSTTREGELLDQIKWPYAQGFAVYGLAEYFRASGDRTALARAIETYELHQRHAWDHERGGIYWRLERDWSLEDPGKAIGSLAHAIETASSLLAATGDDRYLADINQLLDTIIQRTYDPAHGCVREWCTPDWEEDTRRTNGLVDYGHNTEVAWFTSVVGCYTGNRTYLDFGRSLLAYVLRQAWDPLYGGIFSRGRCEGGVESETKEWWKQAEMLGALSMAYRLSDDVFYLDWLRKQAEFIYRYQRDPRDGEWYSRVRGAGEIRDGRKGSPGKAAYHVVQALYHADRNLAMVRANGPTVPGAPDARWEDFAL
jgi:mannose/cellobiose epimerase-like protein (N-acyl-D-glucosamine 2-epimerase family)